MQPLQQRLLQLPGSASVALRATLAARCLLPRPPAARLLYRERSKRAEGINFKALPLPPGRGGYVQQSQAAAWRTFLEWERSNPQRLEHAALVARCVLAWVDGCRGRCAGACLLHVVPAKQQQDPRGGGSDGGAAWLAHVNGPVLLDCAIDVREGCCESFALGCTGMCRLSTSSPWPASLPANCCSTAASLGLLPETPLARPAHPPLPACSVSLTYDQALMVLLHYPDVWLDYVAWHAEGGGGGAAAAAAVLAKARKALPACLAVQFAAADQLEASGNVAKAKEVYETLVEHLKPVEEGGAAPAAAAAAPAQAAGGGSEDGGGSSGAAGEAAAAPKPPAGALALSPEEGTLAWIQYMRFERRAEGIMAARKVGAGEGAWAGWGGWCCSAGCCAV